MKFVIGIFTLLFAVVAAQAQEPKAVTVTAQPAKVVSVNGQEAKALAELAMGGEKIVKNSPFSAEAESESVQTLADGNRIVHKSTSKLYRNGEGRFRREMNNGSGGILGSYFSYSPGVTILDPVAGSKYLIDDKLKTAQQQALTATILKLKSEAAASSDDQKTVEAKKVLELANLNRETVLKEGMSAGQNVIAPAAPGAVSMNGSSIFTTGYAITPSAKYESKTEQLGVQNVEGVEAEGTRTTTTIPAGAVGNERPIEIVYERWFSKDLQVVVMSKNSDPRSGEQTYRLTNIVRSEPDPSLFTVPQGYKTFTTPVYTSTGEGSVLYRVSPKGEVERAAPAAKSATTSTPAVKATATPAPVSKPKP